MIPNDDEKDDVPQHLTPVIASREFTTGDGKSVLLEIHQPERDPLPNGSWQCRITITEDSEPDGHLAFGEDTVQALVLALHLARINLGVYESILGPLHLFGEPAGEDFALRWTDPFDSV